MKTDAIPKMNLKFTETHNKHPLSVKKTSHSA